jgi:hypothetical protein
VKAVNATNATLMHAAVTGTMQSSTQLETCVIQFLADKGAPLMRRMDADARRSIGRIFCRSIRL